MARSGRSPQPTRYDPQAIADANTMATRQAQYAKDIQRAQDASRRNNVVTAVGKNTPAYLQPPGGMHPGMSRVDQDAAVSRATGAPLVPPPQMNLKATPAYSPGATQPGNTAMGGAFRGSTPQEIAEFNAGKPGSPNSPGALATAGAVGKGEVVQTPYGTASSTDGSKGVYNGPATPIVDASGTQTGVGLPGGAATWQEQIVQKYPAIGQKGTQANADFVDAYKKAQASGGDIDHHGIADQVMKNITTPKDTGAAALAANQPKPDIAAPPPISPSPSVQGMGGTTVPADQTSGVRSPQEVAGANAAQTARSIGQTAYNYGVKAPEDAAIRVGKAVAGVYNDHVLPFFKGFFGPDGSSSPTPSGTPSTPQSSPTPTVDQYANKDSGTGLSLGPNPGQGMGLGTSPTPEKPLPSYTPNQTPNTAGAY